MDSNRISEPGKSLLAEALLFLSAHGIDVIVDWDSADRRFYIDGARATEGDIIAKAVALGMLSGSERVQ